MNGTLDPSHHSREVPNSPSHRSRSRRTQGSSPKRWRRYRTQNSCLLLSDIWICAEAQRWRRRGSPQWNHINAMESTVNTALESTENTATASTDNGDSSGTNRERRKYEYFVLWRGSSQVVSWDFYPLGLQYKRNANDLRWKRPQFNTILITFLFVSHTSTTLKRARVHM